MPRLRSTRGIGDAVACCFLVPLIRFSALDDDPAIVDSLREAARGEGFSQIAVAPAVQPRGFSRLVEWIDSGFAGEMHYLADRLDAYRHPAGVLEGARSVIMLTYPYPGGGSPAVADGQGRLARYLWTGDDYHDVVHPKLKRLRNLLQQACPQASVRGIIDTAPLMERDFARLAGIGWQGKNTLLINKFAGSYFFLAALVTDLSLPPDVPHESDHCGSCRRCLDACPTDAFPQPGVLDASRCISYLTIEHRGVIPEALREQMGSWVFGCDVCQEVCPWNRKPAKQGDTAESHGVWTELSLVDLFAMDEAEFRDRYRKTPLWRARRRGLLRNAAIALGNERSTSALPALTRGLHDAEPLVRGASAWAMGRIGGAEAFRLLGARLELEADVYVRREIDSALLTSGSGTSGSDSGKRGN